MKQSGTQAMLPINETNLSRSFAPTQAISAQTSTTTQRSAFFSNLTLGLMEREGQREREAERAGVNGLLVIVW